MLFLEFEQSGEELWKNYLTGIPNERILKGKEGEIFMDKIRNRLFDDWYTLTSDWNERFGNSGSDSEIGNPISRQAYSGSPPFPSR